MVYLCRHRHAYGFVWTFGIVLMSPEVEGGLVAADATGLQFAPDIQVHALVAAVVLGTARSAAFKVDAEGQPPS
jgi:hypothetical protein